MPKVLLADDSATMQKVVDHVLKEHGFEVAFANTGEEAIKLAGEASPDIILVYIKIPGIDGYQVTEAIKGNPATSNLPVILLAGAFDPVDTDRMTACGADSSFVKPFQSEDLLNKIKEFIAVEAVAAEAEEEEIIFAEDEVPDFGENAEEEEMSFADTMETKPARSTASAADPFGSGGDEEEVMAVAEDEEEEVMAVAEDDEEEVMAVAEDDEEEIMAVAEPEGEDLWGFDGGQEAVAVAEEEEAEVMAEVEEEETEVVAEAEPEPAPVKKPAPARKPASVAPAPAAAAQAAPVSAASLEKAIMAALPKKDDLANMFGKAVHAMLTEQMQGMDLRAMLMDAFEPHIKLHLEKVVYDLIPELTDRILKETIQESLSSVNKELENIIWETVPELAEAIINKELERIREETS